MELWPVKGFWSVQYKLHLMTSRTWIMIKFLKNLELECNSTNPNKSVGSLYLGAEIIVKYWKPRFSQFFAYSGGFLKRDLFENQSKRWTGILDLDGLSFLDHAKFESLQVGMAFKLNIVVYLGPQIYLVIALSAFWVSEANIKRYIFDRFTQLIKNFNIFFQFTQKQYWWSL